MSENAQKPRKIPAAVLKAQAALERLRGEDAEKAAEVEKALPIYAMQLDRAGETVTEDNLLDAARQGADYLKANSSPKKKAPQKTWDMLEAYAEITGKTLPQKQPDAQEDRDLRNLNILNNLLIAAAPDAAPERIQELLDKGATAGAKMHKSVRVAAQNENWPVVDLLLQNGGSTTFLSFTDTRKLKLYQKHAAPWQKKLRRAPPKGLAAENPAFFKQSCFEAVLKILDIEGINGKEANVAAFRLSGLFQSEQRVIQYLKQWGGKDETPLYTLSEDILLPPHLPDTKKPKLQSLKEFVTSGMWLNDFVTKDPAQESGTPNIKDWGDAVLKCGPSMARLVKFSRFVTSPEHSSDGKTWSTQNTRAECAKYLYKRAMHYPDLAELCYNYDVKQQHFDTALSLVGKLPKQKQKRMPDITIDGEKFGLPGGVFRRLPENDVRGLFLGEITACCQSIGKMGEACTKHGYLSENGGFYVVESGKGDIIGQSWAWRGKKGELCFDSLETLGDRVSAEQWTTLMQETAQELTARTDHDVTALHIGAGGRTPVKSLKKVFKDTTKAKPKDFGYFRHRDSRLSQIRVWRRSA